MIYKMDIFKILKLTLVLFYLGITGTVPVLQEPDYAF